MLTKGLLVSFVIIGKEIRETTKILNEVIPVFFEMFTVKCFTVESILSLKRFIPNNPAPHIIRICIHADGKINIIDVATTDIARRVLSGVNFFPNPIRACKTTAAATTFQL